VLELQSTPTSGGAGRARTDDDRIMSRSNLVSERA